MSAYANWYKYLIFKKRVTIAILSCHVMQSNLFSILYIYCDAQIIKLTLQREMNTFKFLWSEVQ